MTPQRTRSYDTYRKVYSIYVANGKTAIPRICSPRQNLMAIHCVHEYHTSDQLLSPKSRRRKTQHRLYYAICKYWLLPAKNTRFWINIK